MAWDAEIDMEEVRSKLEGSRTIRFALDSLEEHLPPELASETLTSEFTALRKKIAEMERRELRKVGHREYMILAPARYSEHFGDKAATAVRTLDELGLIIRLDD
jgi:hypothetical protein